MRRLLLVALAACGPSAHPLPNAEPLAALAARVEDHLFRAAPNDAVGLGLHAYDGVLPDISPAGLDAEVQSLRADETALATSRPQNPGEREERDALLVRVRGNLFNLERAGWRRRNPMRALDDFGLDAYIVRDYAPAAERAAAVVKLCNGAAEHLDQNRAALRLPVPKPWLETAIMMTKGLVEFADKDVRGAFTDPPPELGPALDACKAAFTAHVAWLEQQLPAATMSFALGKETFVAMLEANEGIKIDLRTLKALATEDLERNLRALQGAAHELKKSVPEALAEVAADRPSADGVIALATQQTAELRQFLLDHHIVTLPGTDVAVVRETPSFERWNIASLSGTGPFETAQLPSYFYISPPDPTWTPAVQAAYIPSKAQLWFTTIHEVYPGHFVAQLHQNRLASRTLKSLGTYAVGEGWAHYAEEMMYDEGAGGRTPQAHIGQLTEALLRDVRFLVAIGEHTGGMSVAEATTLFETKAFQDPGNAQQQAVRGTFDPMYLSYTLGKLAILKLRTDWKVKHPDGTLQQFHDAFLAHIGDPLPVIRRELVGDEAVFSTASGGD